MTVWSLQEAIDLIVKLEAIAPKHGAHVALTGGLLYKDGRRKDADIMFYRIRQVAEIDVDGLSTTWNRKLTAFQSVKIMDGVSRPIITEGRLTFSSPNGKVMNIRKGQLMTLTLIWILKGRFDA